MELVTRVKRNHNNIEKKMLNDISVTKVTYKNKCVCVGGRGELWIEKIN